LITRSMRIRRLQVRNVRHCGGVQEIEVCRADAAPGLVGSTRVFAIAGFPAPKKAVEPNPIAVKELHNLEQVNLGGASLQPVTAAVSSRSVDDPGISKRPHDLG